MSGITARIRITFYIKQMVALRTVRRVYIYNIYSTAGLSFPAEVTINVSPLAIAPSAVAVKLGAGLIVAKLRLPEPSVLSKLIGTTIGRGQGKGKARPHRGWSL